MGKYSQTNIRQPKKRDNRPHPVWRGIGCLLMVIVPLLSFAFAEITVNDAWAQQYIPYQLLGNPVMPAELWKVGYLNPILSFLQNQTNLYGALVFFVFYTLVLGAFVSVGNALLYKAIAPPRYGPQDAPPPNVKVKRYKR
ncbi:MAG TPA: hypothetical protein VIN60_03250 [Anaerolineales bacterium]